MIKNAKSAFDPQHARSAHLLSCLLLASILFGATFQIIHRHGSSSPYRVANVFNSADAVDAGDGNDSSNDGTLQSKDCSICQLHRQLADALLYGSAPALATPAQYAPPTRETIPHLSATTTPQRGRAPPQASLN